MKSFKFFLVIVVGIIFFFCTVSVQGENLNKRVDPSFVSIPTDGVVEWAILKSGTTFRVRGTQFKVFTGRIQFGISYKLADGRPLGGDYTDLEDTREGWAVLPK